MSSKREVWVDYVKVFACVLVVLGHFFQSMVKANILPENDIYMTGSAQRFTISMYRYFLSALAICIRSTLLRTAGRAGNRT